MEHGERAVEFRLRVGATRDREVHAAERLGGARARGGQLMSESGRCGQRGGEGHCGDGPALPGHGVLHERSIGRDFSDLRSMLSNAEIFCYL
jgi:hypothetical protein